MRMILAALFLLASYASAEPIAQGGNSKITITLYDEPCQLKDQITNLQYRATWEEGGKKFKGCFAINEMGIVIVYFEDKTVIATPAQAFHKVREL